MFTLVTILKVKKTSASYLPSAVCPPALCFPALTVSTAAGNQSGDVTALLSGRCAHSQYREAQRRGQTAEGSAKSVSPIQSISASELLKQQKQQMLDARRKRTEEIQKRFLESTSKSELAAIRKLKAKGQFLAKEDPNSIKRKRSSITDIDQMAERVQADVPPSEEQTPNVSC
ncbi:unnamed protein product [Ranitomeya imitator]|uniref:Uncharacterized protein n=1 Tax=Ranitomeya imitator TaxID=111125 RepID=A0ABN9M4U3_9NEOB|nr:unnamed protein product [Ranitomeya imitator]